MHHEVLGEAFYLVVLLHMLSLYLLLFSSFAANTLTIPMMSLVNQLHDRKRLTWLFFVKVDLSTLVLRLSNAFCGILHFSIRSHVKPVSLLLYLASASLSVGSSVDRRQVYRSNGQCIAPAAVQTTFGDGRLRCQVSDVKPA